MRAVDEDEEDNFAAKYLQQSFGPRSEPAQSSLSVNQLDYSGQVGRWEDRLSDLTRVESILRKRKVKLQEMDAELTERRHQLEDVVYKRKTAEGRLRRAEEDAGIIEQRAAETSVELIRAGNQLINLEIKEKAMTERQEQMNKTLQAKSRELKEIENSSEVVRQNVDKLNQELRCKIEELENKRGLLKEVESRIQLSLRVEELRQLLAQTEKEEKTQREKYVRALKEGEKALEDKTLQLARTRNEIQSQMTEFHELNSKISKLRAELKEVQEHVRKEKVEVKSLSERRQQEIRIQERKLKNAEEKLAEINKARNESMDALKNHREEFAILRKRIHDSMNKMKECEEMKIEKKTEYEQMLSVINEDKTRLENELSRLKSEKHTAEESLGQSSGELIQVTSELGIAREELLAAKETKDSLTQEIRDLQEAVTERKEELRKAKQEIADSSKELEAAKKKFTEIREKRDEMTAEMKQDNNNTEKLRIDSLPQESSTPKIKENDHDTIISRLHENIKHLVAANEDKQLALEDARTEVKGLKEFIETERMNFREYLTQMASESEVYRQHLASLQMEHVAEKQKYSMEKESLLLKTEEHRFKAKKVSEELSHLKQNHTQTKLQFNQLRDTLAKDVKELKKHIEGITIQMKAELARSLKKVENSKEQTSEEIDNLREKEDEMEIQLAAIQQSISTVKDMALIAIKEKTEASKQEKEETLVKEQGVKLLQQQTYLKGQIRQQMSTRAEALDEERKKAEVSLEGLKNKLKNLEEVISRKDSSVEDFRLKLLQNKIEAERTADSNKQIDALKRRLRVLEDEKDLIESQRNHLVALNEGANLDHTTSEYGKLDERTGDQTRTQSKRLIRSLDSLMDGSLYTKPIKPEWELPCRDEVKLDTSFPGQFCNSGVSIQSDHEHNLNLEHSMTASRERSKLKRVSKAQQNRKIGDTLGREADKKDSFETDSPFATLNRQQFFPQPNPSVSVSRKELSTDTCGKMVFFNFTNPEELYTEKSLTLSSLAPDLSGKEAEEKSRQEEQDTIPPAAGSAAMFADDRKSEFLSTVYRLKNEKVRELELSLQRLFLS